MQPQTIRVTDIDSSRLEALIDGLRPRAQHDATSVDLLERHLEDAEVMRADRIGPDVVTMNSEVRVRYLDSPGRAVFRVVYPGRADAAAGRVSVLAPLGMAVLGRAVGELVTWQAPGGLRRLRIEALLYQPEREGKDVTPAPDGAGAERSRR